MIILMRIYDNTYIIYVLGKNERSWKARNVTGKNQVGKVLIT